MKLNISCQGNYITVNQISQLMQAAGSNTTISVANANGRPQSELVSAIQSASAKKISIDIDGSAASVTQTLALFNACRPNPNASLSLREANAYSSLQIQSIYSAVGDKPFSAQINGAATNESQIQYLLGYANGLNTSLTLSSITSMTDSGIATAINAAGSRRLQAQIDGKQASPAKILYLLDRPSGANISLSLINSEYISTNYFGQFLSAAGSRNFTISFDVTKVNFDFIKQTIAASNQNTRFNLISAQALTTPNLKTLLQTASNRKISINLNGAQFYSGQPLSTVQLGNLNNFFNINTAQATNLVDMLAAIKASAGTNLALEYNGAQLVVTPTDGNYVVRAIQVAQEGTEFSVNSVGQTQFNLNIVLDIIYAAH
ncbi:hypothetical protein ACFOJE_16650 [Azotobacter bryophylli]|jgi:hypothetical protein|uniref:Uncharacterized protein n=1 Tax=Azotobacter bryophylli TaxID=1986537 RepID=A0ABV7AXV4_9GAMM